ncbi:MAG TPA: hypothetical protein VFV95_09095 [Vicinamibacterales bacterium]|nr:hypothetical protein [Vicinamibacterales bacterium]
MSEPDREIVASRILCATLVCVVMGGAQWSETAQNPAPRLPARLEHYLKDVVGATSAERARLMEGSPITRLLEGDPGKEVAVFGAIWINAPIRRYVDAVQDIENFERGTGFLVTKRISAPPRLDDFAALRLPQEDVADLRTCRVGNCEVKLGEQALQRFRTEIDWKGPGVQAAADALMRRLVLEYVTGYLEGGNARLAVYRDDSQPTFVAEEFRAMVAQMPELAASMPAVRRYLLDYPKATLPGATSFLYWQATEFGLKPTIRISHLTIREDADETVVASKMLYATHYFWTALELRALVPDPSRGPGFWFVTVNRSRSDGLTGFSGFFIRRRVRSEVEDGSLAILRRTKERLERGR